MNDFIKGEEKRKVAKLGFAVLVLLAVFLAVETLDAIKDLGASNPAQNTISVTGEGEAVAIPDVATFTAGISAEADTVETAQQEVTEGMNAVLSALEDLGVEERDIKTVNYSIYPNYIYQQSVCTPTSCPPGRQVLDGYNATHSISVKLRNTDIAGQALAAVGEAGATDVSGISFTSEDPDEVLQEAREMAIEEARENARELAKKLGVRLGKVVTYYDSVGGQPMPYGMGGDMVSFKESAQSAPVIPQGENKVVVNVTVVYEIR